MSSEATLKAPLIAPAKAPLTAPAQALRLDQLRRLALVAGITVLLAVLALAAWEARRGVLYASGKGFGYAIGLVGGVLMLGLLLYPLRKRLRFMQEWGALKHWFRFHMIGGVFGPLLVLFHSTFKVGSVNAAVALSCMLLVVASGLVGRFMYRKIHHGLYGSHANLKELEQAMAQEFAALEPVLRDMPLVKQEVEQFTALVALRPEGSAARAAHFLSLGAKRMLAARRLRNALAAYASNADVDALLQTIDRTLQAAQRRAQFSTYERLFSLWHVVHIPFLFMLLITALVHVVAVHAY